MNKWTKIILTLGMMFIVSTPLIPSYVMGWKQETSANLDTPNFTTHQWLAWEALKLSPTTSMLLWITDNELEFWLGVEAPYNSLAAEQINAGLGADYGDINSEALLLNVAGTTVTNSSLADRAQEEYDKLVAELGDANGDYALAAFYAGAMSHYISQAGLYAALWNETRWGALNIVNWNAFEDQIEATLLGSTIESDPDNFNSSKFDLDPLVITPVNASQAAINLAIAVYPVAESLGDDFLGTWTSVDEWTGTYFDNVEACLEYSAEAIYAALKYAMEDVNWKYLTIEDPAFEYNQTTGHLTIQDFSVNYTDNTGTYVLDDVLATQADLRVIASGQYVADPWTLQPEINTLNYNDSSDKWNFPDELLYGSVANREHTILYTFNMDGAYETWSNSTIDTFEVMYFLVNLTSMDSYYHWDERTLDIWNVQFDVPELPEVGFIDDTNAIDAQWFLYTKGEGTQVGEAIGVLAYDTAFWQPHGDLAFNATGETWYSYGNDIGLIFTQTLQQYYVVVKMTLVGLPVGYMKTGTYGTPVFYAGAQGQDDYWFITKDHQILMTQPDIEFDAETNTINVYGIEGWSDYGNTSLDKWELEDKPVYGQDIRAKIWKIFLFDGIPSSITGELTWDYVEEYWYAEDISVNSLPDNTYYLAAKLVNMNLNATVSPWGPQSEPFTIKRPVPVIYWILPEIFLAGFIVLFGWLIWWRPRQKKLRIEREREEKLDKGFMD
ncbi:MAG TPA: hypothetical protein VMX55_08140 [candidate division Zixibacteria bacterium]|nr:hypothetical protein [candidate division Zixibacteria bacterium]